jgi:biotin carboxyl carrier protein
MERRAGLNSPAPFALGLGAAFAFWHRSDGVVPPPIRPLRGLAGDQRIFFNHCHAHGELAMRSTLKMPKVGDAVDEVVISEIQVQVGTKVAEGQTLFTVETDKTQVEVPAPFAGTVAEIRIAVGDDVKTGAPTLVLEV